MALGATVDPRTYTGETPLHLAVVSGHVEVVRALVDLGAQWDAADQDGENGMDKARKRNKQAVVAYLSEVQAEAPSAAEALPAAFTRPDRP